MKDEIRNALANSFDDVGNFDGEALSSTLYDEGYHSVDDFNNDDVHALAAAIEYYDGDIEQALATIERGKYRHCPDAETYEDLGWAILREETNVNCLPQIVCDYMDFEALGEDAERWGHGKFTRFGYFEPEKW